MHAFPFFVNADPKLWEHIAPAYLANAIEIPSSATDKLCDAAKQAGVDVVVGIAERDTTTRFKDLLKFEHTGDSFIIDPCGEVIAGPAKGETILIAEGSREAVLAAKASCDIGGHYSRPDLLRLANTWLMKHTQVSLV